MDFGLHPRFPTLAVLLISLGFATLMAWANWSANEDLYMTLAAGRDAVNGLLAQPDQWSFVTGAHVWVNQGWLSGVLYYLSFRLLDEGGPVLIKGFVLACCLVLLFWRCRALAISSAVSLTALALGTLSISPLFTIRAETFGLLYFVLLGSFLVAPERFGMLRQVGSVIVIGLWSNSHGSAPLGFMLVGVKAALEVVRTTGLLHAGIDRSVTDSSADKGNQDSPAGLDEPESCQGRSIQSDSTGALGWVLTWAICLAVLAFATPFGLANIEMPFRQVGTELWTTNFRFWAPLLQIRGPTDIVLYHANRSLPFVAWLVVFLGLVAATWALKAPRRSICRWQSNRRPQEGPDVCMEFLIALLVVGLTFRWGRAALFAGLGLVPPAALLMGAALDGLRKRVSERSAESVVWSRWVVPAASLGLLALVLWAFLERTLPPYLPNNPMMADSSVVKRIHGIFWDLDDLTGYLRRNGIQGNVLSDYILADFLLFHVPGIKIWTDLRTQSIYSETAWKEYDAVYSVNSLDRSAVKAALEALERYRVSAVVLWLGPRGLVNTLMGSGSWVPIYFDDKRCLVFVKKDSEQFKTFQQDRSLARLWYPNQRTRALSTSLLWWVLERRIPGELMLELKALALEKPGPVIYELIWFGGRDNQSCLAPEWREYFFGELRRLASLDYMRAEGVNSVLYGMLQIVSLLEQDQIRCLNPSHHADLSRLRRSVEDRVSRIRKAYLALGER